MPAAKSLQSCPTLCDPINGSPPGSPVPGILQARVPEWVTIAFSRISVDLWTKHGPLNQTHALSSHLPSHPLNQSSGTKETNGCDGVSMLSALQRRDI